MRQLLWVTLLLGFAGLMSCEKKQSGGGGGPSSSIVRMVYIPKNTGNPYFDPLVKGFEDAAKENGAEFHTVAPATPEATSQLPLIKDQIQQGVNVLAISPNSPDACNAAFREAMKRGITVITVDSDLTGNEQDRTAGVLT